MLQFSTPVRNARLDAIEVAIGPNAVLEIRSGAAPANTAAARTGTVLATVTLPADWMGDAAGASKALSGVWTDSAADAAGTAGYFNLLNADKSVCHIQGTVTATGGGGDMTLDNVVFAAGQQFTVTQFTINEGNG